jgi:chromosomal replication initiator protein
MNGSSIQPERAWQMALDQLRLDMPKASFDTWVRDTGFVSFEDGVFTIGTPNAYGREWLASRLTSTVTRLMTGILNQLVVEFVVTKETEAIEEDDFLEEADPVPDKRPTVLSIQAEYQSIYDEIVQPDHVIVVPGYFM